MANRRRRADANSRWTLSAACGEKGSRLEALRERILRSAIRDCQMRHLFAIAWVLVASVPAWPDEHAGIPVRVGGDAALDACSSVGAVSGLTSGNLRVRLGPGTNYASTDSIATGQMLWLCDQSGPWQAVVYTKIEGQDCGVSSPIAARTEYSGPCQSGWVHEDFVSLVAG